MREGACLSSGQQRNTVSCALEQCVNILWLTDLAQGQERLQCGWLGLRVCLFLEELESREMGPEAGGKPAVP